VTRSAGRVSRVQPDFDRIKRVAAVSELVDIVLIDVMAARADAASWPDADLPGLDVTVKTRHDVSKDHLHAWVTFKLSSEPSLFELRATYRLVYSVSQKPAASDARAFANVNAVFNAWPYWREAVQSFAARMGLPAPTVPLLKF